MRITWVAPGPLSQTTGGYLYDRIVVEGLRAAGDEVTVATAATQHLISLARREATEHLLSPARREATEHPLSPERGEGRGEGAGVARDIIIGDELAFATLARLFSAWRDRALRVLLVHHLTAWEKGRRANGPEHRALHAADLCIATSHATARRLTREEGLHGVVVVPPGADRLPRLPRPARRADRLDLLFVGSLVPRKGLPALLDALESLADPRVRLVVAGDPARDPRHAAQLAARIRRSPLLRRAVRLAGPVTDRALAAALCRADLLVLPSRLEGYGMVLTEALHAGLPVLATRTGAAPALARLTGAVTLVAPDDAAALARALARLVAHPERLRVLERNARAAARALPRWRGTVALFRATLARSKERRRRAASSSARGGSRRSS